VETRNIEPVDLFYSYAHEDEALRDELAGHLKIMERRGVIRPWHDRDVVPGKPWDAEINEHLLKADLVLLLVSKDFINSDYIWGLELDVAMKRHANGEASVVPVMLRAVDITDAPFADLQGLPTDLKPVTSWANRDEAWTDVAKGIRRRVEMIQEKGAKRSSSLEIPSSILQGAASDGESEEEPSDRVMTFEKALPESVVATFFRQSPVVTGSSPDPLLDRVVQECSTHVMEAAKARGVLRIDEDRAHSYARALIDAPDQKRILWVDDRPANNRYETAALAKLQIEVVPVTSTKAALDRLESDPEPFDLVLSDWHRPELHLDTLSAGIHLLRQVRKAYPTVPVVFYHGSFETEERVARREQVLREGAFGEAVMPDELLELVAKALAMRSGVSSPS